MEQSVDKRASERLMPTQATVVVSGKEMQPVQARLLDESFGGIGVLVPPGISLSGEVDVELSQAQGGIRCVAFVRNIRPTDEGGRVGLEWKAQALSRGLRRLLQADKSSQRHKSLGRILPGGLSVMWKLYEDGKWQHIIDSADRLRKEAAACEVHELREPIDAFQSRLRTEIESAGEEMNKIVRLELDRLIATCIRALR